MLTALQHTEAASKQDAACPPYPCRVGPRRAERHSVGEEWPVRTRQRHWYAIGAFGKQL
jgi:hypothetical protein